MKTFIIILVVIADISSVPIRPRKRGIDHRVHHMPRRIRGYPTSNRAYRTLFNSPPLEFQYGAGNGVNDYYLKDFDVNSQDAFSQLTSQDLSAQHQQATISAGQSVGPNGQIQITTNYGQAEYPPPKSFYNGNGYGSNPGLGAYGSLFAGSSVKYSQPIQSAAPSHTRLTSSPVSISYPTGITSSPSLPNYNSAYSSLQSIQALLPSSMPASAPAPVLPAPGGQSPITLGSGSLGITRLNNGNYALGSGSIGYGGSAPIVGPRPQIPQQMPVFDDNNIQQTDFQGISQFYRGI